MDARMLAGEKATGLLGLCRTYLGPYRVVLLARPGFFSFLYFLKNKISKIYVDLKKIQKWGLSPGGRGGNRDENGRENPLTTPATIFFGREWKR